MAVRKVLKMGAPTLYAPSQSVDISKCPKLDELVQDMIDTMREYNGVGISAPQIGVNKRIIIFGFDFCPRYPNEKPVPFAILINPEIEYLTEEKELGWEGCVSVPGLRGEVPRFEKIKYKGITLQGETVEKIVSGFHARIVQHECDHLDGILFPERIENMKNFGFEDSLPVYA